MGATRGPFFGRLTPNNWSIWLVTRAGWGGGVGGMGQGGGQGRGEGGGQQGMETDLGGDEGEARRCVTSGAGVGQRAKGGGIVGED